MRLRSPVLLLFGSAMVTIADPDLHRAPGLLNGTKTILDARSKSTIGCCGKDKDAPPYANRASEVATRSSIASVHHRKSCEVGPNTSILLACEDKSGIFLRNDNPYAISPQCQYLATYASDIMKNCVAACGRSYDTDNYSVIVRDCKKT
ncbi:hypothetical protein HYFRA_00003463 [Hymenoscyphus fraxineus]|uniref:Uncharacterized protein n=1 Tax=Hymenoscyphus fraxineus TaxID=746836 RepID=A0A9N9KTN1_9HELO|nr:hypothetical protein HYFRA_00003463 [Hymenoscyphus fraxineus]